jgi:hypothetical protein
VSARRRRVDDVATTRRRQRELLSAARPVFRGQPRARMPQVQTARALRRSRFHVMWNAWLLALAAGGDLAPARIELAAGRADLAGPEGVVTLLGGGEAREVVGPAYLELGAASRLALRWRGEASLEVRGSSALEWRAPLDGAGVLVIAWRVSELDFEVRRGPLRLDLGSGWRIELDVGAAGIRRLADGRLELRHVAGAPLALFHQSASGLVSPPWTVLPGSQVRLEASTAPAIVQGPAPTRAKASPERHDDAPPWSDFAWPWPPSSRANLPFDGESYRERHGERQGERAPQAAPARIENSRVAPASAADGGKALDAAASPLEEAQPDPSLDVPRLDLPELELSELDLSELDRSPAPSAAEAPQSRASSAGNDSGPQPGAPGPSTSAPAFDPARYAPVRREGVLVPTPFGPRWADRP